MTAEPFRLPSGGAIDRTRTLCFTFDGRGYTGHPGDTLASALLANGVRLVGRSFKYHRPRGILTAGSEEPNALVGVGRGGRYTPNLRATQVELYDGLVAESQNRWPSLAFDVGEVNDLAPPGLDNPEVLEFQAALLRKLDTLARLVPGFSQIIAIA